ncbi:MAG TPA: hypothetical protein VGG57_14290 [Stellaceae bacterium]|jgi:hypothetical protein
MDVKLAVPIAVGDRHRLLFRRGAGSALATVDYQGQDAILLHFSLRRATRQLVVNDCKDGRWGHEDVLTLTPEDVASDIAVDVGFGGHGIEVAVNDRPAVPISRRVDIARTDGIRLEGEAEFDSGEVALGAPADARDTPPFLEIRAEIERADIAHVAGRLWAPPGTQGDLVATVDGRPAGQWPIDSLVGAGEPNPSGAAFSLVLREDCLVADGMELGLVLAGPDGTMMPLASRAVASIFLGGLDRCSETLVRGWVCNPFLPNRPVNVSIFLNELYQGTVLANRAREDLSEIWPEAERSGFIFRFSRTIFLPVGTEALVSVKVHNTGIELDHSPWHLSRRIEATQLALKLAATRMRLDAG